MQRHRLGHHWRAIALMARAAKLALLLLLALGAPLAAAETGAEVLARHHVLERLLAQTGVRAKSGTTPGFVFDPAWPQRLPHNWIMGAGTGIFVDRHDHIWVLQRPRSLTYAEAGAEPPLPGAHDAKGVAITGAGFERPHGAASDCCKAAPSVLEFDTDGRLLRAWGGPADPGFIGGKCKAADGCIWPNGEHGLYVDDQDNVWIGGNSAQMPDTITPWTTNHSGGDGFILKFDADGHFKLRIGGTPKNVAGNDRQGGVNGTPLFYRVADMVMDAARNRLYVADGYGNRRIVILDASTGKYLGHFTAYGNNPVDDKAIDAAGIFDNDAARGKGAPGFFRNSVHCVALAADGKLYVCDRGNDRIQIFDTASPALGKPCRNPHGEAGQCGYLGEQWISPHTEARPTLMPGTASSIGFSRDAAQSCLYVADNTNQAIHILSRAGLGELGQLGKLSQTPGDFRWLHQLAVDSQGNIYADESDPGSRAQKFLQYGAAGCSGAGVAVGGPAP